MNLNRPGELSEAPAVLLLGHKLEVQFARQVLLEDTRMPVSLSFGL